MRGFVGRVPPTLKHRDRLIGRGDPVLDRYARVTFDKTLIIGKPQAELMAPGHPLLDSVLDLVLERFQPLLQQGGVLVDDGDEGVAPRLLVYLEHAIRDGRVAKSGEPRVISQRLQFIHLAALIRAILPRRRVNLGGSMGRSKSTWCAR